ncbi:hypothetical protein AYR57_01760 [Pediococcus claussenii]|nr:hypothetical protein AYR57_01760 [Pediococcus claussenii]ANZ70919.1 hypothetical protein AYR58_01760 [Pediococcus claussenii]
MIRGYQIDLTDRTTVNHLLNSVNTNDSDGYVKNYFEPLIKNISSFVNRKIYLPAGGPNNTLILVCSKGKVSYSVFNLSARMNDSLDVAGVNATVKQLDTHSYTVMIKDKNIKKNYLQSQLEICKSIDPQAQFSINTSK